MTCLESPVAQRLWHDTATRGGPAVSFLGIIASAQHSADCHPSGHNCASTCGGQESPVGGVGYNPNYAHALDIGFHDQGMARGIVSALILDPRTRYCILDGVGYFGTHYKSGTFRSFDHTDHVHWSGLPGSTFATQPFYVGSSTGDDAEMLSPEAQKFIQQELKNQDDRIVARVEKELVGTPEKPGSLSGISWTGNGLTRAVQDKLGIKPGTTTPAQK